MATVTDSGDEKRNLVRTKCREGVAALDDKPTCEGLEEWMSDLTLERFLRANNGEVDKATCQLCQSWGWRVETNPRCICCPVCLREPSAHSMRPIGFDALGRLVIYACFSTSHNRVEPRFSVVHMQRIMEDAQVVLDANVDGPGKWVIFMDFHGMTMGDASPSCAQIAASLLKHYPERMGCIALYESGAIFEAIWKVITPMLNDVTKSKVCFFSTLDEGAPEAIKTMGPEVLEWLRLEVAENRTAFAEKKKSWEAAGGFPDDSRPAHDPRGLKSFVESDQKDQLLWNYADIKAGSQMVPVVEFKVDRLFGGKLGVRLKGLIVSGLDVDEAGEMWNLGDEVLEVNGNAVGAGPDFGREVKEGLKALPMIVKVFRHGPPKCLLKK